MYLTKVKNLLLRVSLVVMVSAIGYWFTGVNVSYAQNPADSTGGKKDSLQYPIKDKRFYEKSERQFDFEDPDNIQEEVIYNPEDNTYTRKKKIGETPYGIPEQHSFDEFLEELNKEDERRYFKEKSKAQNMVNSAGLIPELEFIPPIVDKIFGAGLIDIKPTGSAEVTFGGNFNEVRNPNLSARQQKNGQFDFQMKMQLNVTGSIGDRVNINWNYDTEATFEFENQMKLNWEGEEDDIVKNVELGNVSLPLNGSLISGGQSLFGLKTKLQFGKLTVTAIATQQKGETKETTLQGGAQVTEFNVQAHNYEADKHFFIAQYFADNYDESMRNLPVINSGVQITYIEVWVTNSSRSPNNSRSIVGYTDLGEASPYNGTLNRPSSAVYPSNAANELYDLIKNNGQLQDVGSVSDAWDGQFGNYNMDLGEDYAKLTNARLLSEQEYTFNERLGYISLNTAMNNDDILAVAFEYTYNGQIYTVGDLTRDVAGGNTQNRNNQQPLTLKLLRTTNSNSLLDNPMWNLMMKNIYNLGGYNVETEDFRFQVVYADDKSGADLNYLPVDPSETQIFERQLLAVLNLDEINRQNEAKPDGRFDLIEGVTFQSRNGRIIFPVREPFGSFLRTKFNNPSGRDADYYAFDALYDSTRWLAEQDVQHNKFFLRGSYKGSSSNELSLGAINVPEGSVRVTANGAALTEGQDYIVDYTLGRVKIINEGLLNSGAVIKVSSESNQLFNVQQKSLLGTRLDYKFSDNLLLGGTFLHMRERPLTPKTNIGEEPLLNSIYGFDVTWDTESRFLTRMVDKLPFIETKEISTVSFNGEFAQIIPHRPKSINDEERGISFIDDFEAAETPYDLRNYTNWRMASTPKGQLDLFPEAANDSTINFNRGKLAWYTVDVLYQNCNGVNSNLSPEHICDDVAQRSNHLVRSVRQEEVFPEINLQQGVPQQMPMLDIAFYPDEKGPYNYNSASIDANGDIVNPEQSWGGIMRRIEPNDFQSANIDYIEIWMMDPFVYDKFNGNLNNNGQLYIHLGNVSEDVLPDGRRSYENGLYDNKNDTSDFAIVPSTTSINSAFDNSPAIRSTQDAGLDGMNDEQEREFFANYLQALENLHGANSAVYTKAFNDPSNDNYVYHLEPGFETAETGILTRYKNINNPEGNSTLDQLDNGTPKSYTVIPDDEDINNDQTVNEIESYFQYKIELSPTSLVVGQNYVTDSLQAQPILVDPGQQPSDITWYQLKIPIREYQKKVGNIGDFRSIRFMRMAMKGFSDSVVLRFAQMQMVRAEWRRYVDDLKWPPQPEIVNDPEETTQFVISTVNIEENSLREPINYVLPPGYSRELDPTQPQATQQNEQSLSLRVCGLKKGDARAAYKTSDFDIRNYKSLRMFIHAEGENLQDDEVSAFLRIGTDLQRNYYQYEIPLKVSPDGTTDANEIWPEENNLDVDLEEFYNLKLERDKTVATQNGYYEKINAEGHKISIVGLPDMSNVRVMMIGIMHPEDGPSTKEDVCAEIWVNEFRLADFVNKGGYAARARLVTKLADLATLSLSGNYTSIGFGGIDQTLNERALDETIQYDIAANVELGKFFPQKTGITVPMFINYSETFINPKYNPLNPDILLKTALKEAPNEEERERVLKASQDYTSRYSINFTNVKKNRTGNSKVHLWDIENFNVSYSYQKIFRRNPILEEEIDRTYRASLGYNYSKAPKPWEPFKTKVKNKNLRFVRDFNLYFFPQSITMRLDIDRRNIETQNRNNDNFRAIVPRFYDKSFSMNRFYSFNYNITKSLKMTYNSTMNAFVEEPYGPLDTEQKTDTLWNNFYNFGTPQNFNQQVNFTYQLPFSKIRMLSWINSSASYGADYGWTTAPPAYKSLGNTIQNSQRFSLNNTLNMNSLYNRFPKVRKLLSPPRNNKKSGKDDDNDDPSAAARLATNFVLMLKQVQLNYTENKGTTLPGYNKPVDLFGQNFTHQTPGWDFIMGVQDPNIRYELANGGHLTTEPQQNNRYIELSGNELTGNATLEPIPGFRVQLNISRRYSKTLGSNFRADSLGVFDDFGYQESGMMSMTFGSWSTAFDKVDPDNNYASDAYDQFLANRIEIATRLQEREFSTEANERYEGRTGEIDPETGYPIGFGSTHQEVLLYSFLSAYSGKEAGSQKLDLFPSIPIPSWRITYNGLNKLKPVKKLFSNVSFSHAFSSILNVNSFVSSVSYGLDTLGVGRNLNSKYLFRSGVTISERFSPLIGIDITMQNGLTFKFEYKKDKTMTLSLINPQMIEQRNKEYVIGAGYRTKGLKLPFKIDGRKIILENDLNFRFDFSIRDGVTILRRIDDINEATAGVRLLSIRPTIDYMINKNLNLRAFYTRNVTEPKISSSYPSAITQLGITLRYTLQ